jgi:hypothetical protein
MVSAICWFTPRPIIVRLVDSPERAIETKGVSALSEIVKTKVTASQLKDLIQQRLGFAAFLTVHKASQGLGFTASVVTAPAQAIHTQQVVDAIVQELRAAHELIDG